MSLAWCIAYADAVIAKIAAITTAKPAKSNPRGPLRSSCSLVTVGWVADEGLLQAVQ
ncbi:hypothetical protein [Terriglobus aquaticus]|uniref:Uncharacterized protein n=1 Tax=Terriglobus aquaticus TaxID=940139 RepID=A0ABW9KJM3_9BACT